jgi:hypothetical protein
MIPGGVVGWVRMTLGPRRSSEQDSRSSRDSDRVQFPKFRGRRSSPASDGEPVNCWEWSSPSSDGKTVICGECRSPNYPSEWYCERCGADLGVPSPSTPRSAVRPPPEMATDEPTKNSATASDGAVRQAGFSRIPISEIHLDTQRFRRFPGPELEVTSFNQDFAGHLGVWRDPADGKNYLVDGYRRYALAVRHRLSVIHVQWLDFATADEAFTFRRLKNADSVRRRMRDERRLLG